MERLLKKGIVKRVTTGVFYIPKKSVFGELKPKEEELIKSYLFKNNKRIAYITGTSLYNRMGLTTQIPKTIKVASKTKRITTTIGNTQLKPVKSYVDVTNKNYRLLEILDALKDFKTIPDLNMESAITILMNKLDKLSDKDRLKIVKYALQYPPRTQAILGAILELSDLKNNLESLKANLNPLTKYNLGIKESILPTAPYWNIY